MSRGSSFLSHAAELPLLLLDSLKTVVSTLELARATVGHCQISLLDLELRANANWLELLTIFQALVMVDP